MEKKIIVLTNFGKYTSKEFHTYALKIRAALDHNTFVEVPEPVKEEIKRLYGIYMNADVMACTRDIRMIALRNESRKDLIVEFNKLAKFINSLEINNRSILKLTGFKVTPKPEKKKNL